MPKLCEDTMLKPSMDIRAHWHMSKHVTCCLNYEYPARITNDENFMRGIYQRKLYDIYMGFIKNVFTFILFRVGDITNRYEKSNLVRDSCT